MSATEFKGIEDIVPHINEHLVPEIKAAVDVCIKAYSDDEFNDMWTFGTHFWKNTWNRFKAVAENFEDCPFLPPKKGNEYKLRIGPYAFSHHRVIDKSTVPLGANAAKQSAATQMTLFGEEWEPTTYDSLILAIDVDIDVGLREVFIGELKRKSPNSKEYTWGQTIPIYPTESAAISKPRSGTAIISPPVNEHAPEEEANVAVSLDKNKLAKKEPLRQQTNDKK